MYELIDDSSCNEQGNHWHLPQHTIPWTQHLECLNRFPHLYHCETYDGCSITKIKYIYFLSKLLSIKYPHNSFKIIELCTKNFFTSQTTITLIWQIFYEGKHCNKSSKVLVKFMYPINRKCSPTFYIPMYYNVNKHHYMYYAFKISNKPSHL